MGRNIYLRTAAIIVLLLLPPAEVSYALGSGLEVESHKRLNVVIEGLDDGDRQAGLTEELIRAKVELQLRQNGISPTAKLDTQKAWYLYVRVDTVRKAFCIDVQFTRLVTYSSEGRMYESLAGVWDKSITGVFAADSSFILQQVANGLDLFINDYLKANQK